MVAGGFLHHGLAGPQMSVVSSLRDSAQPDDLGFHQINVTRHVHHVPN